MRLPYARGIAAHAAVIASSAALAVVFTWPMAARLDEPVSAHGDGAMFLWNLWWFRHALLDLHVNPFFTDLQFHPIGVPLYLHTLTPARGLLALPLLPLFGLEASHHLLYLASFVLGAWGMFLLARELGFSDGSSLFAAFAFSFCQYHVDRGYGLFNLTEIQWFPFYFLFLRRGLDGHRRRDLLLASFFLLLIAYSDYYYLCFGLLLGLLYLGFLHGRPVLAETRAFLGGRGVERVVGLGLAVALAAIVFIIATGGTVLEAGPVRLSMRGLRNPVLAALLLAALKLFIRIFRSRAGSSLAEVARRWIAARPRLRPALSALLWLSLPFLVGFSPVLAGVLVHAEDYRGALSYNDVFSRGFSANLQSFVIAGTFFRPNGFLARWWSPSDHFVGAGMGHYLGLLPVGLAVVGAILTRTAGSTRFLIVGGLVFLNLSLGPSLHVGSEVFLTDYPGQTLLLYNALRRIPILSGCRAPGRFVVMVIFCLALLAAAGLDGIERRALGRARRWARTLALLATVVLLFELYPGPYQCRELPVPSYYRTLSSAEGTLLDLPLSWASGWGCLGSWDSAQFYYQTVHGRPLFSGQVSRVSQAVFDRLRSMPLLGRIMDLQLGASTDVTASTEEAGAASAFATEHRIRHVVLHWDDPMIDAARMRLVAAYLASCLELEEVYRDRSAIVWRVVGPRQSLRPQGSSNVIPSLLPNRRSRPGSASSVSKATVPGWAPQ